jgi:tetratricopeptide (TPR) repeat protein
MRLAQRSLDLNPANAVATHSVAHVYFERGDAAAGADFLRNWLNGFDCPASSYVHLSWHLAVFELALGQYQRAIERYEEDIRPYVVAKSIATLPDSASFVWWVQMYSGDQPSPPLTPLWDEVRTLATPMAEQPGFAFQVAHAALALAASNDQDALTTMMDHLQSTAEQGDAFSRDMVVPLVQGIVEFAQGEYAKSAQLLEPVCPQLVRIGGSHAQREVFEDTMLEAYIRAEQFDQAEAMLRQRLAQRESVRDTFWLGRVQGARGQTLEARDSLNQARNAWQGGNADAPELGRLNHSLSGIE